MVTAVMILLVPLGLVFTQPLNAQPLNNVVEDLLEFDVDNILCGKLLSAGVAPTGSLAAYCSQVGSGSTSTSGGGAASPQTSPGIIQDRLQALREDQGEMSGTEDAAISELAPGWSVFFSAEGEKLDRDVTTFEDGYDSDIGRLTIGTDFQLTDKATLGVAATYSNHQGNFDGGGDFDNNAYGLIAFASLAPHEKIFVQATMGYAFKEYDRTRSVSASITDPIPAPGNPISGSARGDYNGSELSMGVLMGYDHVIGSMTIGPRLGVDWIYNEFDSYTEQGGSGLDLVFDESDQTSLQSRVGLAGTMAISTGFGVIVPQVNADWVHEFANAQRTLAFSFADDTNRVGFAFQNESPDRDFFELAVGISAVLPNGWLPFVQFRTIAEHEFLESYVGTAGLRIEL
jgi:outer membrane autotransporter protein